MPLRIRLTAIAVCAVALTAMILVLLALDARQSSRDDAALAELRARQAIWRESLHAAHLELESLLDRLAETPAARLAESPVAREAASEGFEVQVIGNDGSLLQVIPGRPNAAPILDAAAAQRLFNGRERLTTVAQQDGRRLVAVAAERRNESPGLVNASLLRANEAGERLAIAVTAPLEPVLQRLASSLGLSAYLVNRRGALLSASDPELWPLVEPEAMNGVETRREIEDGERSFALLRLPVINATGNTVAYLVSVEDISLRARASERRGWLLVVTGAGLLLLAVLAVYALVRQELQPLDRGVQVLDALAGGELNQPIERRMHRDEVGKMLTSLTSFRDSLILARTAERQKDKFLRRQTQLLSIQRELRIAAEIQKSILPEAFPERPNLSVAAMMRPAKDVGGDFFDVFEAGEAEIAFTVADVSDKGVPAALFMAVSRTLMHQEGRVGSPPPEVMARANDALAIENPSMMFVTAFYGLLDPRGGRLRHSNAGHNPAYLLRPGSGLIRLDHRSGPALGVMEEIPYAGDELHLQPGDTVFSYTDGITEAFSRAGEEFGAKRLEAVLEANLGVSAERLLAAVLDAVDSFAEGAEQSDDITCLAIGWSGPAATA